MFERSAFLLLSSLALSFALAAGAPGEAHAGGCDATAEAASAESRAMLRQRYDANDWPGTNKVYQRLVSLGCPIGKEDHHRGARAAEMVGDIGSAMPRYRLAVMSEVAQSLRSRFAEVRIVIAQPRRPLTRVGGEPLNLSPSELAAVERAADIVAGSGAYQGYLPAGTYGVGSRRFTVVGGAAMQSLQF